MRALAAARAVIVGVVASVFPGKGAAIGLRLGDKGHLGRVQMLQIALRAALEDGLAVRAFLVARGPRVCWRVLGRRRVGAAEARVAERAQVVDAIGEVCAACGRTVRRPTKPNRQGLCSSLCLCRAAFKVSCEQRTVKLLECDDMRLGHQDVHAPQTR